MLVCCSIVHEIARRVKERGEEDLAKQSNSALVESFGVSCIAGHGSPASDRELTAGCKLLQANASGCERTAVSLDEVAARAAVSKSTVSRAFSRPESVRPNTR